nr:hypothetical protein [Tanacetum cinerariifolium]
METSSQPLSDAEFWILVMRPDVELTRGMMNGENNILVAIGNNGSWWRVTNNVTVEGSNLVVGGDPKYQDAGSTQRWRRSVDNGWWRSVNNGWRRGVDDGCGWCGVVS